MSGRALKGCCYVGWLPLSKLSCEIIDYVLATTHVLIPAYDQLIPVSWLPCGNPSVSRLGLSWGPFIMEQSSLGRRTFAIGLSLLSFPALIWTEAELAGGHATSFANNAPWSFQGLCIFSVDHISWKSALVPDEAERPLLYEHRIVCLDRYRTSECIKISLRALRL